MDKHDLVNNIELLPMGDRGSVDISPKDTKRKCLHKTGSGFKVQNLSVDGQDGRKEHVIVSSPSLDSSLRAENCYGPTLNKTRLSLPKGPSASATSLALPSSAPLTPNSAFLSQSSQDSGFQSALSFDLPNIGTTEASSKRNTTTSGSSVPNDSPHSIDSDCPPVETISSDKELTTLNKSDIESLDSPALIGMKEITETDSKTETPKSRRIAKNLQLDLFPLKKISKSERLSKILNIEGVSNFADGIVVNLVEEAITQSVSLGWSIKCSEQCSEQSCREDSKQKESALHKKVPSKDLSAHLASCSSTLCWTPEIPYSPSHHATSRRSSVSQSHDSLVCGSNRDDSHLITGAVSHDSLAFTHGNGVDREVSRDIYSSPVDTLRCYQGKILQPKAVLHQPKLKSKRTRFISECSGPFDETVTQRHDFEPINEQTIVIENGDTGLTRNKCFDHSRLYKMISFCSVKPHRRKDARKKSKSFSIRNTVMNLFSFRKNSKEVRCVSAKNEFIEASSQCISDSPNGIKWGKICPLPSAPPLRTSNNQSAFSDPVSTTVLSKDTSSGQTETVTSPPRRTKPSTASNLLSCLTHQRASPSLGNQQSSLTKRKALHFSRRSASRRALPPLPNDKPVQTIPLDQLKTDHDVSGFASIIQKVKDYGWYWGPISGEAAEKVLSNEPDGSFIVRDSSDTHYIFSLTFRLDGVTRHVRIEHDQGNFSFGGFTRFKSQTIVDFIEKAVEHSRSGRYLFFLHRKPVLGPMRVQLLHPVSRFKHVQSLQHLCRFVIVKHVRRDLIYELPLPQRLKDYLSSPHYYSEMVEQCMSAVSPVVESTPLEFEPVQSQPISQSEQLSATCNQTERCDSVAGPSTAPPAIHIKNSAHSDSKTAWKGTTDTFKCTFDLKSDATFLQSSPSSLSNDSSYKSSLVVAPTKNSWINSWYRSSDSHLASLYSSPTSPQFSVTSPSELNFSMDVFMTSPNGVSHNLARSFSTGCLADANTTSRSAYHINKHSLVSALALDRSANTTKTQHTTG